MDSNFLLCFEFCYTRIDVIFFVLSKFSFLWFKLWTVLKDKSLREILIIRS